MGGEQLNQAGAGETGKKHCDVGMIGTFSEPTPTVRLSQEEAIDPDLQLFGNAAVGGHAFCSI